MRAFQCERCGRLYPLELLAQGKMTIGDKGSDYVINLHKVIKSEPEISKAFRSREVDLCINCLIELLRKKGRLLRRR